MGSVLAEATVAEGSWALSCRARDGRLRVGERSGPSGRLAGGGSRRCQEMVGSGWALRADGHTDTAHRSVPLGEDQAVDPFSPSTPHPDIPPSAEPQPGSVPPAAKPVQVSSVSQSTVAKGRASVEPVGPTPPTLGCLAKRSCFESWLCLFPALSPGAGEDFSGLKKGDNKRTGLLSGLNDGS